jgi:hypothetical protein
MSLNGPLETSLSAAETTGLDDADLSTLATNEGPLAQPEPEATAVAEAASATTAEGALHVLVVEEVVEEVGEELAVDVSGLVAEPPPAGLAHASVPPPPTVTATEDATPPTSSKSDDFGVFSSPDNVSVPRLFAGTPLVLVLSEEERDEGRSEEAAPLAAQRACGSWATRKQRF